MGKAIKPERVLFARELPKTRSAKIMRRVIRATYLGQGPRRSLLARQSRRREGDQRRPRAVSLSGERAASRGSDPLPSGERAG